MNSEHTEAARPDPDALLREVQKEEQRPGRLKIFLGYSPGVGKTYTMLEEAHLMRKRGDDVVVGIVETHSRAETAALLEGLEVLPRRVGKYQGIALEEMDLDAILARKPAAVLVDELAHSNAPWCKHPKRWLDVEEILAAGIDVYTTVNIQHFESQNDIVAKITGIRMHETVPDDVLERADEVQVVDIPLEELFERLREGKVYIPEQAQRAMEGFFQRGHLVALREITLSAVARKMSAELVDYMKSKAIQASWPSSGKLLVCIGPSPYASQLVRKAYRLARNTHAEWYVVNVESPSLRPLSLDDRNRLAEAFNLAEEFGAKTATLSGEDVVPGLLRFARANNVSHIVIGRPRRSYLLGALRRSPVYRLLTSQADFDLYIVTPTLEEQRPAQPQAPEPRRVNVWGYVVTTLAVALGTVANLLLHRYVEPVSLYSVYLIITLVVALTFGTGPSVVASVLSVLAFDFFFIRPELTFSIHNPADLVSALVFLATSIIVGQLTNIGRRQRLALQLRVQQASVLDDMGKELLALPPVEQLIGGLTPQSGEWRDTLSVLRSTILDDIAQITVRYANRVVPEPAYVFFSAGGRLRLWARSREDLEISADEAGVAEWTFVHGEPAGSGTDTLTNIGLFFIPMKTQGGTIGVIGVRGTYAALLPEQRHTLGAVSNLASLTASRWLTT
jgi:two-component system, OmpR family, sensor histidine kinase KdpD